MKELESLKNIAPYVCGPLFAIALAKEMFSRYLSIEGGLMAFVILLIFSILIVPVVLDMITAFIFRYATYGSDPRLTMETMPLPYVVGLLCITLGIWGLAARLFPNEVPASPLNIFWHLGFLSYGFRLL